jgi:hypothetical protein
MRLTLFEEACREPLEPELRDLMTLNRGRLPVARTIVVPAAAEAEFYRLNNLPGRLGELFKGIDEADPDDDDIEELAPEAERLVAGRYLLDEFIDLFYEALSGLPEVVRVRRPSEEGAVAARGRSSLLALKRNWSEDWGFERLWDRLSSGGPLLPAPRPLLIQPAPLERLSRALENHAGALLGRSVELFGDPDLGITLVRAPGSR